MKANVKSIVLLLVILAVIILAVSWFTDAFKDEEKFMDHMCELMVETGQAIQLFAYGKKDWHSNHSITPFYKNVQSEAILL